MANDMGLMAEDERLIAYCTNEEPLVYNSWQECEGIGWFVWSVWFFWLKETNQMNQINQENHE